MFELKFFVLTRQTVALSPLPVSMLSYATSSSFLFSIQAQRTVSIFSSYKKANEPISLFLLLLYIRIQTFAS